MWTEKRLHIVKRTTKKLQNGHNIVKITKGKKLLINTARRV